MHLEFENQNDEESEPDFGSMVTICSQINLILTNHTINSGNGLALTEGLWIDKCSIYFSLTDLRNFLNICDIVEVFDISCSMSRFERRLKFLSRPST